MSKHARSSWWPNRKRTKNHQQENDRKLKEGIQASWENRTLGHSSLHKSPTGSDVPVLTWKHIVLYVPRLSVVTMKHDTFLEVAHCCERKRLQRVARMRNVDSCRLQSAVLPRTDAEVREKTELMGMSLSSVWTSDLKDSFASLAASFQVQQWEAVLALTSRLEHNSRWN